MPRIGEGLAAVHAPAPKAGRVRNVDAVCLILPRGCVPVTYGSVNKATRCKIRHPKNAKAWRVGSLSPGHRWSGRSCGLPGVVSGAAPQMRARLSTWLPRQRKGATQERLGHDAGAQGVEHLAHLARLHAAHTPP